MAIVQHWIEQELECNFGATHIPVINRKTSGQTSARAYTSNRDSFRIDFEGFRLGHYPVQDGPGVLQSGRIRVFRSKSVVHRENPYPRAFRE